jgi:type I restriction enzyme S subunit
MTGTSGRQRAQSDSVAAFKLVSPCDEKIWSAFGLKALPIFDSIKSNAKNSEILAGLRETLLPNLSSGELRIVDLERIVGVAL